jgi:hypothetical protein
MSEEKEEDDEFYPWFTFDPSNDEVLGVFKDEVHIRGREFLDDKDNTEEIVLIIPRKEYLRVWNNWLDGKKQYCENWKHYCGVMGYTFPKEYTKEDYKINLITFDETKDVDDPNFMGSKDVNVYKVTKFIHVHDFEHG